MSDSSDAPQQPHRLPDQLPLSGTVGGLAVLVVAVSIAAALPLSPLQQIGVSAGAALGIGLLLVRQQRRRDETVERLIRDRQTELREWQSRWQALRLEKRQTASVLHQMTDGVIVLAPDRSIELINPSARRLLALRRGDSLLGRSLPEVVRVPEIVRAIGAATQQYEPQELSVEISDGSVVRPLRLRVDRIRTAAESDLLLTLRDETETRRVDEVRRMFVANVSHELKTPLAAIKGYAETVEMAIEDDPEAARHFMSQIRGQCQRLEALIEDMMQLARAQAGREKLDLVTLSLSDIIAESFASSIPIAEAEGVALSTIADDCSAQVTADLGATLTIANNLISNAIRYTPRGGGVRVGVRRQGDYWALVVEDDGIGIAQSDQERIFERFYRVDKNRRSSSAGTGLGLSIVKNLTRAQGGKITLESRPGEGSTFEVWLPAAAAPEQPEPASDVGSRRG